MLRVGWCGLRRRLRGAKVECIVGCAVVCGVGSHVGSEVGSVVVSGLQCGLSWYVMPKCAVGCDMSGVDVASRWAPWHRPKWVVSGMRVDSDVAFKVGSLVRDSNVSSMAPKWTQSGLRLCCLQSGLRSGKADSKATVLRCVQ
jgi:hypothetical protein